MSDKREDLEGGCLCGQLRYRISAEPIDAGYCHCRMCQRSSGAPVLAWLTVSVQGFQYLQGAPALYQSSARYQREFCSRCGTQIAFRAVTSATKLDVTLASLDDTARVSPEYHIWCESEVSWLHIDDDLPRYLEAGPDVP